MKSSCTPAPVWCNGWKHHLHFLSLGIKQFVPGDEQGFRAFCNQLKVMGQSLSDLYLGNLNPHQIREEILQYLKKNGLLAAEDYEDWLESTPSLFREMTLSDSSRWTLLKGKDPDHYIHIHPSRYSPHTIRINTNHLRTAAAWMAWKKAWPEERVSPEMISRIRSRYLDLSAISESQMKGINRTIRLLEDSLKP